MVRSNGSASTVWPFSDALQFKNTALLGPQASSPAHLATSEPGCDEMQARTPAVPEKGALSIKGVTKGDRMFLLNPAPGAGLPVINCIFRKDPRR
jgi:hypothetical protein